MTLLEIKEYIEAEQKASRLRKGFVARCLQIRKYLEKVFPFGTLDLHRRTA